MSALEKKFDRSVSLVSWGYNEEELIEAFLTRAVSVLSEAAEDFEVVFVNDGSTDRTGEIADAQARRDPRIRVLHNSENRNVGYSCRRAIAAAEKEFMFWQTVDWPYDLTHLRIFLELIKRYDVLIGVRAYRPHPLNFIPGARVLMSAWVRSDDLLRGIVSAGNCIVLRALFGVPLHEFQSLQFYHTEMVQALTLVGDSSFISPEILFKCYKRGATYVEVPIQFAPRKKGEAKRVKISMIARSLRDIASAWFGWGWKMRGAVWASDKPRIFALTEPHNFDKETRELTAQLMSLLR